MMLIARYNSTCRCGAAIKKGDEIERTKSTGAIRCSRCPSAQVAPDLGRMFDMAYEDQCAAACGLDGQDRGN